MQLQTAKQAQHYAQTSKQKKFPGSWARVFYQIGVFYSLPENPRCRRRKINWRRAFKPVRFNNADTRIFRRANAVGGWINNARIHAPNADMDLPPSSR